MFFSHRFFSSILLGLNGHNNQATCYKMICFQENALGTSHAAINLLQSFMVPWFPLVLWFALNDQDHQVLMGLYGNIFPGPLILVTYLKRRPQKGIKYIKLWRNMTNIEKAWKSPNTFPMKFPVPHGRGITEGEVGHGGAWDVTCTNTLRRDTHPTHCVVVCPNSCFENPFFSSICCALFWDWIGLTISQQKKGAFYKMTCFEGDALGTCKSNHREPCSTPWWSRLLAGDVPGSPLPQKLGQWIL